ncbi:hypothetical protein BgiBS90_019185 [Biomphalaria glabrata]|nr:hypothetical protein BgiBS90_019185 [Biomphalaria glabrata]
MFRNYKMFVLLTFISTNVRSRFTSTEILSLLQEQVGSRPGNENYSALEIGKNMDKHSNITNTTNYNKPYLAQEESTESSGNFKSVITKTTNYNKPYFDQEQSSEASVELDLNSSYCDINIRRNEAVSPTMDYFTALKRENVLGLSICFLLHRKKRLFHHEHIRHSINSTAPDTSVVKLMNHSVIKRQAPVTRQQHMLKDSKFQNSTLNVTQKRNRNDVANNGNNASCVDVCGSFLNWPSCSCDVRCFVHRSFCENISSACANLTQDVEKRFGKEQIRTGAVCNYELNEYVVNECNNKTDMQSGQFSELSSIR